MGGVEITALTTVIGLFVWYLKYTTKQNAEREKKSDRERNERQDKRDKEQEEERGYYRGLIKNEIKGLYQDSLKNADLNNQSITLIKNLNNNLEKHNKSSQKAWEKNINTLNLICDKMNGGNPEILAAKKSLNKDSKKNKAMGIEKKI